MKVSSVDRPLGSWSNARGQGEAMKWLRDHMNYDGAGCLIWPFSHRGGYGSVGFEGRVYYAHRVMCELKNGPPPTPEHQACHSCGKGHEKCVSPMHLNWKTVSENMLDKREHGTVRNNPHGNDGILTAEQIAEIRALKGIKTQAEIAGMFEVKRGAVQYWHRHDRPKAAPGTSSSSIYRRARKAAVTYKRNTP